MFFGGVWQRRQVVVKRAAIVSQSRRVVVGHGVLPGFNVRCAYARRCLASYFPDRENPFRRLEPCLRGLGHSLPRLENLFRDLKGSIRHLKPRFRRIEPFIRHLGKPVRCLEPCFRRIEKLSRCLENPF